MNFIFLFIFIGIVDSTYIRIAQPFENFAAYTTGTLYRGVFQLSDENLEALISIEYHRLEKGLSHYQRRSQFGSDAA